MSASSCQKLALPKPAISATVERRIRRGDVERAEAREKAKVRRRDWHCRWPRCNCRTVRVRLEVGHVTRNKGMGGDHGTVSSAADMMQFCVPVHQGATDSLHAQTRRVIFLTPQKANGPCRFEHKVKGKWIVEGEEIAPGVVRA